MLVQKLDGHVVVVDQHVRRPFLAFLYAERRVDFIAVLQHFDGHVFVGPPDDPDRVKAARKQKQEP